MPDSRPLSAVELLLLANGIALFAPADLALQAVLTATWVLLALVYVVASVLVARRASAGNEHKQTDHSAALTLIQDLTPIAAALVGLMTAISELSELVLPANASDLEVAYVGLDNAGAVTATLGMLGWVVLHIGFAQLYDRLGTSGSGVASFAFPATENPCGTDFIYFAFAVGTTFATSDVDILTAKARRAVTAHSVLSFLYNAVVIAVVVRIISGA